MKIGILGGTFDPLHNGHLEIAEQAMYKLGLSKVLFIPAGEPPSKERSDISSAEHRVKMVYRAVQDRHGLDLSRIELERPGPSYTVDTLNTLRSQLEPRDELYFIIGWDSLIELPEWKKPAEVIKICKLVAFPRSGLARPDLKELENRIPGISRRVIMMETAPVDISSSEIRRKVAQGLSIKGLVPVSVLQYIKDNGLYKADTAAAGNK